MNDAPPHNTRQPAFTLELRAVPGHWRAAPEQRLKGLLKVALRAFGFRCEVCRASSAEPAQAAKPSRHPDAAPHGSPPR